MIADAYKVLAQASFRISNNLIRKGDGSTLVFGSKQRTARQLYNDALDYFQTAAHCKYLFFFFFLLAAFNIT